MVPVPAVWDMTAVSAAAEVVGERVTVERVGQAAVVAGQTRHRAVKVASGQVAVVRALGVRLGAQAVTEL